ncbi:hypothetical protein EUGRSUZ_F04378 [Eucalyptus grandis]|uniref:Uncharacterized protein n=2 Tax=Eucalyptus grandis TaxID=71139 RepID=A0ACC3KPV4_EUCGR|nr:hypothetical protein EUGRSUZ_F04378 [Eucalyptus grandis]
MDLSELWAIFSPGFAGAVFGAGWWFWVDAVVCSSVTVSFVHYLPGTYLRFFGGADVQLREEGGHRLLSLRRRRVEVEALAFLCLCCFLCLSGSICGPINSRFTRDHWTFSLDWSCWCLAMCVCVDQWTNLLDGALGVRL